MARNETREGYELLVGHSSENARKAIDLAIDRGFGSETVIRTTSGYLIPLEGGGFQPAGEPPANPDEVPAKAEIEDIEFPDPESASHPEIDEFATAHDVTYEDIEAKNSAQPNRAEKVAHIEKVIRARAEANDAHLAQTGELRASKED